MINHSIYNVPEGAMSNRDLLHEHQQTLDAVLDRIRTLEYKLERKQEAGNPLEAFEEDHLDAAPLLAEVTRLAKENRELRDALRDAQQNAEATILLTKMAFGG